MKLPAEIQYKDENVKMSVIITLAQADFETILLNADLASSKDSTFISFGISFITDMAGNSITSVVGLPVSIYGTVQEAAILSYTLDLTGGTLNMSFSGVVDTSTLLPEFITLHDDAAINANALTRYSLTSESSTSSPSGFFMSIDLSTTPFGDSLEGGVKEAELASSSSPEHL